ncbi:hypothetical protein N7456_006573 [Penicillium angulare]|uniref:Uncharacterized protein n=1 Tax=Penicillium angulare TaxID=116970 RepID=A0A9W9FHZ2_9EURO|nr:hypothetical protein N7456_006573 [Penicillium angulare]
MDNHQPTCDCSQCIPPQELLHHPCIVGKWETKADLAIHHREQELRAISHLKEVVDAPLILFSPTSPSPQAGPGSGPGSGAINEETKEIITGILRRRKELTKAFNIGEVQLLLTFWRYQQRQTTAPSLMLCMFLQDVMEPHAPKSYKTEKVQKDINGRKRAVGSDGKSNLMIRKEAIDLLFKHGVGDILNELFLKNPRGIFRFEYGCATFYPSGSDFMPENKKSYLPATVEDGFDVDADTDADAAAVGNKPFISEWTPNDTRQMTPRSVTISDSDDEMIGMSMPSGASQVQPIFGHILNEVEPGKPMADKERPMKNFLGRRGSALFSGERTINIDGMEKCLQKRAKRREASLNPSQVDSRDIRDIRDMKRSIQTRARRLEASLDRLQVDSRDAQTQMRDLQQKIEDFILFNHMDRL